MFDVLCPWQKPEWPGLREQLRGPPGVLVVICMLQIGLLVVGTLAGLGTEQCEVVVSGGTSVSVECHRCVSETYITWQQAGLLAFGCAVVMLGVFAALYRSKRLARLYGMIMLVYSFVVGLTSLLTGVDSVVLDTALSSVSQDEHVCRSFVESMVHVARFNSVLYALSCLLDLAGAMYAIKSKEHFQLQEIHEHHERFASSYGAL